MKKMIAPILVTIIVLVFLVFYLSFMVMTANEVQSLGLRSFLILIILLLISGIGAMVYILTQRLKEIREEDKDDLSKY